MDNNLIYQALISFSSPQSVFIDEPMSKHTSFRIGGPADVFVIPQNMEQLKNIYIFCKKENIPVTIMGNGSNLLVRDKGIRGVVIKLFKNMEHYKIDGNIVEAEAGILLSKLANIICKEELEGFEFASGIPGTLGGAIFMNAGAYDGEMSYIVSETTYMDREGKIKTIKGEEHNFSYRKSFFQTLDCVILSSKLQLKKGVKEDIRAKINDYTKRRVSKQPLMYPSAGSVFKRPVGYYAGKLIQDSGLQGYQIGGAQVSEMHCGFIINRGGATAKDVLDLIKHVQKTVNEKFNAFLETEIKIIGEE